MIINFITILILPNNYLHSFSEEAISKLNKLKIESSSTLISYHNLFDRGYTGHEHLTKFGLINMNGRTYDPWLGRMLQPDNYVQAAGYLQNYNRYSYVMNNPLKYTDPDGEWVHIVVGAVIGGTINWIYHGAELSWDGAKYFGIGAAAGALAAGVGAGVGAALAGNTAAGGGFAAGFMGTSAITSTGAVAGAVSGAASGATSGLILGTGNGMMSGMNFGNSILNGLNGAWKGAIGGIVTGSIMGTMDALYHGEDWLTGSPYKKYCVTDGTETVSIGTAKAGATKGYRVLHKTNDPYPIEIEAPKGWTMTEGNASGSIGGEDLYPLIKVTDNNSQVIEFPLGTPNGGHYGAVVSKPLRLLNHNNHQKLFYNNSRDFSTFFWFLSLVK